VFILPWTGSLVRALPQAGGTAIASAVFLGLAPSAAGFVLWAHAMARMDVGRVTLGLYLVPAAAIVISLVWLGQIPGPVELAGGVIALAGVILASTGDGRHDDHGDRRGDPARNQQDRPYFAGPSRFSVLVRWLWVMRLLLFVI
jgi:drug/metabolite transporter (DMT)-like permease